MYQIWTKHYTSLHTNVGEGVPLFTTLWHRVKGHIAFTFLTQYLTSSHHCKLHISWTLVENKDGQPPLTGDETADCPTCRTRIHKLNARCSWTIILTLDLGTQKGVDRENFLLALKTEAARLSFLRYCSIKGLVVITQFSQTTSAALILKENTQYSLTQLLFLVCS